MTPRNYRREWRAAHPLYQSWINMRRYCRGNKYYAGISICREWETFAVYERWCLDHGWTRGLLVARIDKDKDFSPGNCKVVTMTEFNGMRRCVRKLEDGRTVRQATGIAWERDRVTARRVRNRVLNAGWDIASALSVPRMTPRESVYIGLRTRRKQHE